MVKVDRRHLDEVLKKLSLHSCSYQTWPAGYRDLMVVDGELLRCELLPDSLVYDLVPLTLEEFRVLWEFEDRCHSDQELGRAFARRVDHVLERLSRSKGEMPRHPAAAAKGGAPRRSAATPRRTVGAAK